MYVPPQTNIYGGLIALPHDSGVAEQYMCTDDARAAQVTAQSVAAGPLNAPKASMEDKEASDMNTFRIACAIEKHSQGFCIMSGTMAVSKGCRTRMSSELFV